MMTDPIADMLTRIRNAAAIERPAVEMPATKVKAGVAKVRARKDSSDYRVGRYAQTEEGQKTSRRPTTFRSRRRDLRCI